MKQKNISKQITVWLMVLLAVTSFISCKKDSISTVDNNKINLVIADNFNLLSFSAALRVSTLDKELQQGAGPYTVMAPSDAAFITAGYADATAVLSASPSVIAPMVRYHIFDGTYELNKLPFLFNQELRSRGGKMYATHWVKNGDTVLTLNGSRVVAQNLPTSNGIIQVINRVLTPYLHDKLGDAVSAEADVTLFTQALKTSGLLTTINGAGPYTIFAPNNAAMRAIGYQSVQQISQTSPAVLKELVSYHIVRDRRFINDYVLSTGSTNTSRQAMLDDNLVNITLTPDVSAPGTFSGITLRGIGNTSQVNVVKQDILTGNGVLHVINGALKIIQ
jgi:uncharacterized surface protein with fasciclin (FAS1) repeats